MEEAHNPVIVRVDYGFLYFTNAGLSRFVFYELASLFYRSRPLSVPRKVALQFYTELAETLIRSTTVEK